MAFFQPALQQAFLGGFQRVGGGQAVFKAADVKAAVVHVEVGEAQAGEFADATAMNETHPDQAGVTLGRPAGGGLQQQTPDFTPGEVFAVLW
ncbi:Uncharacterised protein [Serratia quinivorans]|nr:Uncharacterised protein [Serratia quinivorans]